jgi:aminoglycoside phosphotransferase (APT) family kinase protein
MSEHHFEDLSDAQRENAHAALVGVFGRAPIDAITRITGGASTASTFRIDTGGRRYLLRVEGEPSPLRNPHQYVSMRIAAEAGIAPEIRYLDEAARIVVIDFIAQQPLQTYPGGPNALAQALGALLACVQATPVFPHFVNYPDIVARLFAHVRRTGLFAAGVLDSHTARLERLREAYNAGLTSLVSSHNDSIPSNILFDGERLWMIDWESAYRNDPLVDVAIVLDSLVRSRELEGVLLQAWLGRAPDEELLVRLEAVRALTRLYYAGVVLSASAAASWITDDTDLSAPTIAEFQ